MKEPRSVYEEARLIIIGIAASDLITTSGDLSFGNDGEGSDMPSGGWV